MYTFRQNISMMSDGLNESFLEAAMDGYDAVFETAETDMDKIAAARALYMLIADCLQDGKNATTDISNLNIGNVYGEIVDNGRSGKYRYCRVALTGKKPMFPLYVGFVNNIADSNGEPRAWYKPQERSILIRTKSFGYRPNKADDKDLYMKKLANYMLDNADEYILEAIIHELTHFIDHSVGKLPTNLRHRLTNNEIDTELQYYNAGHETNARFSSFIHMFVQQIKADPYVFSMLLSNKGFMETVNQITEHIYVYDTDIIAKEGIPKPQILLINKIIKRIKQRVANVLIKIKHDYYNEWKEVVFEIVADSEKKDGIPLTVDDLKHSLSKWLDDVPENIIDSLVHEYMVRKKPLETASS